MSLPFINEMKNISLSLCSPGTEVYSPLLPGLQRPEVGLRHLNMGSHPAGHLLHCHAISASRGWALFGLLQVSNAHFSSSSSEEQHTTAALVWPCQSTQPKLSFCPLPECHPKAVTMQFALSSALAVHVPSTGDAPPSSLSPVHCIPHPSSSHERI